MKRNFSIILFMLLTMSLSACGTHKILDSSSTMPQIEDQLEEDSLLSKNDSTDSKTSDLSSINEGTNNNGISEFNVEDSTYILQTEESSVLFEESEDIGDGNIEDISDDIDSETLDTSSITIDRVDDSTTIDTEGDSMYYQICTDKSKAEVEEFAKKVRKQILDHDWSALSEEISYPITIGGVSYEDKNMFSKGEFEKSLDQDFFEALESETCEEMFCNANGIMLATGQVWIAEVLNNDLTSQGLKILAINS